MILLILGLILWWGLHAVPVVARGQRDAMVAKVGEGPYKGLFALLSVGGIVLIVIGYQQANWIDVYIPPAWGIHASNLLMVIAVFLFGASHSKGNIKRIVRHPQLLSVIVWGVSHLLVRGHLAAILLFGGMAIWATAMIFATNARDGAWVKPEPAPRKKDYILLGVTVVLFIVIVAIHTWLGLYPFPG